MPTNKRVLYKRLISLHESSYLSLLSIVQGVATAFLASQIPPDLCLNIKNIMQNIDRIILFSTTFCLIIFVWNEYVMGVATLKWIPTLQDAAIPFGLCIAEIILAKTLKEPVYWFFGASLFNFIGFLAFWNMYKRAKQYPKNNVMLNKLGRWKATSQYFCLVSAVIFFSRFFVLKYYPRLEMVFFVIAMLYIVLFVYRTHVYWNIVMAYANSRP